MRQLYPPIEPYHTDYFPVSKLHTLYIEQSGNPQGIPVIHFHGGPGASSKPDYRRFFNPKKYRVIMFDQRGCGQSTPSGEIKQNTSQDLIKDTDKLRRHLNIDKWLVYGGSWGSTLSLLYAQAYPARCLGLILRGIFLVRPQDLRWLLTFGANQLFPDVWQGVESYFQEHEVSSNNGFQFIFDQLMKGSPKARRKAAAIMSNWERNLSKVNQTTTFLTPKDITQKDIAGQVVFLHYALNHFFLKPNQILNHCSAITHLPTTIIHGRYDIICTLSQAWELHQALPDATLEIIPASGHHSSEPAIVDALIHATDSFITTL